MKILIGADLVPTKSNEMLFCNGDSVTLVGKELDSFLKEAEQAQAKMNEIYRFGLDIE